MSEYKITGCFSFKSKTGDGCASRIQTFVYNDEFVRIEKYVISKEPLDERGFMLIRKFEFKKHDQFFGLWMEEICLRKSTLLNITHGVLEKILLP